MNVTLKRAKLLAEFNPDVLFFISGQTSASNVWNCMYPLTIEVVIECARDAKERDYILNIDPYFPNETKR